MDIARGIGHSTREAIYTVPDDELAVGSTLGGPSVCAVIKGTGAIAAGETLFGDQDKSGATTVDVKLTKGSIATRTRKRDGFGMPMSSIGLSNPGGRYAAGGTPAPVLFWPPTGVATPQADSHRDR